MNTKHELQAQAAKLQDELEKLNKTIASMKDELPEGFVPFEATSDSKRPCHMNDEVEAFRKDGFYLCPRQAKSLTWQTVYDDRFSIASYKIVKKYVEPRPMKFSEIPVGQWFMWSNGFREDDTSVYMKIPECDFKTTVCIKSGNLYEAGKTTHFSESSSLKFYSVNSNMTRGELLTVEQPPEPVEDQYFTLKYSDTFGRGEGAYLMGRRPDGVWFSINKYGQRNYQDSSGNAFGKSEDFDGYVSKGDWIQATLESVFKK
jgi:hypothetical protein